MATISAVVLSRNEEKNIESCLKALSFCKEIIIVDDGSTDRTVELAEKLGAKVYKRELNGDFSQQLNFGLQKAMGDWILFMDPDERISEELKREILRFFQDDNGQYDGIAFKRTDFIWGRWVKYGEVGAFKSIRLVKKGKGHWVRRVHQTLDLQATSSEELPARRGRALQAQNPILHYPHKTLQKFINNINQWSTLHAIANQEEGKHSNLFKIIFFPIGHFVRNYILRFGFLDGMHGFVFALIMASHSYLSWSKQWMLQKGSTKI